MAIGRERAARSILGQSGLRNRNPDNATFDEKKQNLVPQILKKFRLLVRVLLEQQGWQKNIGLNIKGKKKRAILQDTIDLLSDCNNKESVEELKELINLAKND
ncbi:hypothetical protein F3K44_02110 [Bacillus megaterium]|nr:hypothetical protein [Priestia megaterium]